MSRREQVAFAKRVVTAVIQSATDVAVELKGMVALDRPCCDQWEVEMFAYWPERIWILRCALCDVTWTERYGYLGVEPEEMR